MKLIKFVAESDKDMIKLTLWFFDKGEEYIEQIWVDDMIGSTPKNLSKSFAKWVKWLKNIKKER